MEDRVSNVFPLLVLFAAVHTAVAYYECDFTDGTMCGYEVVEHTDDFKWQVYDQTDSDSDDIDMYGDKSSKGAFLYASFDTSGDGDKAESTLIKSDTSSLPQGWYCFRFKHKMFGPRVGTLVIGAESGDREREYIMFNKTGNHGEEWQPIELTFGINDGYPLDYLKFEAFREAGSLGEIAVDDISVTLGSCDEEEGVSCKFTTYSACGWNARSYSSHNPRTSWIIDHYGDHGGPDGDYNTGRMYVGWLLFLYYSFSDDTAEIASPSSKKIPANSKKCLRFRYYLGEDALLNVGLRYEVDQVKQTHYVWHSRTGDRTNKWLLAETSIYASANSQLVLQGDRHYRRGVSKTFAAVDDLILRDGECQVRGSNTFEDGFDLYDNGNGANFDWLVTSSQHFSYIQLKDRTLKSMEGHFALAYFKNEGKGTRANLISPSFRHAKVSCFKFYYHFSGSNVGTLSIIYVNSLSKKTLKTLSGDDVEAESWQAVSVVVDSKDDNDFQILLQATVGKNGESFIAVDDIEVSNDFCGQQPEPDEQTTTTTPKRDTDEDDTDQDYTDRDDQTSEAVGGVSKRQTDKRSGGATWQLPVGLTVGFAVGILLSVGAFVLLRGKTIFGRRVPASLGFDNAVYNQEAGSVGVGQI